jgi:GT2 family glycosyltransferase
VHLNIVTVNYKSARETEELVSSVFNNLSSEISVRVVVVDNSLDNSEVDILNSLISNSVDVIYMDANVGYFPALNFGLNFLSKEKDEADYTIVCNNDLLFSVDFFEKIIKCKFEDDVFVVCPSVKTINNVYQNPSLVRKPSKFRYLMYCVFYSNYYLGKLILKFWRLAGLGIDSQFKKDYQPKEIFIGIGAIFILTPSFFIRNSQLYYPLFLYGEEAFLSKQVSETGGRQWYEPSLEVVHLESVSTAKIPSKDNYVLNAKAFKLYKNYFK